MVNARFPEGLRLFSLREYPKANASPFPAAMPALAGMVAGASTAGVFYMLAALQAASIVATVTSFKKGE